MKKTRQKQLLHFKKNGYNIHVDLCGNLNKSNIIPIAKEILKNIHQPTRLVEFHFEKVVNIDVPAMAMVVITAKNLRNQHITCRAVGLTEDSLHLAMELGLGMMAEIE